MDDDSEPAEPANLRFLRILVTVLTATMIAGVLGILTLLVIRYQTVRTPLPEVIALPDGTTATAFTQAAEWYAVVTDDNRILIFDRSTGALRQTLLIETGR